MCSAIFDYCRSFSGFCILGKIFNIKGTNAANKIEFDSEGKIIYACAKR